MEYTYYEPLNVWIDPASIPDVVTYIQNYLAENPISDEEDIENIVAEYIAAHPELIGGVQSVNGETGEVVLTASDINTTGSTTIQAVLTALSGQISEIVQTITGLDTRVTTNAAGITNEATARANADTALGNRITALQGAVGSPLVAATAAAMTDTTKIYVYTGSESGYTNGNWYYYNGSAWTSGGVYNATAINTDITLTVAGMAADAKATGDGLNVLKNNFNPLAKNTSSNLLLNTVWEIGSIGTDGVDSASSKRIRTVGFIPLNVCYVSFVVSEGYRFAAVWYDETKSLLRDDYWLTGTKTIYPPTGSAYLRLVVGKVVEEAASLDYANEITAFGTTKIVADINAIEEFINKPYPVYANGLLNIQGGIKSNGEIATSGSGATNYMSSQFIYLQEGSKIRWQYVRSTGLTLIAVYDKNLVFDSLNSVGAVAVQDRGVFVMPYDGYVRLTCRIDELEGRGSFIITSHLADLIGLPPDIWLTYLSTKKVEIQSALVDIGNTGESFTFATDVHIPRNNMITPQILRYLNADCPVNYHINGGDFLDIYTDSDTSAISAFYEWRDAMGAITEFCVRGNHDDNNYDGTNAANSLSAGQYYAIMDRPIENLVKTDGKTYYCLDNESQKIRIIVADNTLSSISLTTMLDWLKTKLTEKDSAWTVLVIQHYLWGSTTETIHENGQAVITAINSVYSNIQADFVGILAGHTHVDYNSTETVNGYNLIARNANLIQGLGTNSLSFDYVTINTNTKKINFTKIGLGSNLSLSY